MFKTKKLLIIHTTATSYYKNIVFNALHKKYDNLKVIQLAETDRKRDWKIDLSDIEYCYTLLTKGNMSDKTKWFYFKKIWKELNVEKPDMVYMSGYFHISSWTALVWAKLHSVKAIVEMDSNKFDHKRVFYKEVIKKLFIKNCDLSVTYGKLSKNYLLELGMPQDKIVIKPNVSSSTLFNTTSENKPSIFKNNKKSFIYVGRFAKEKNLFNLIDAFKTVNIKNQWNLILVGSGPDEVEMKEYIQKNNIKNIIFTGFVDKNDLKNYYIHSTVFILPSISEPWGLVTNEAMMCGLPVLISKQCGCSYDLVDDNGYIFDPFNLNDLIEKMNKFVLEEINYRSMSKKSIELISRFTPESASDSIIKAIERFGK